MKLDPGYNTIRIFAGSILMMLFLAGHVTAQGSYPLEKILIRTDRDLYIAGERVNVKIFVQDAASGESAHYSDIVYLELMDRMHAPLVRKKYLLENGECDGSFYLPYELGSEHYYIRAYTGWMKNGKAAGYAYRLLGVINPFGVITPGMVAQRSNGDAAASGLSDPGTGTAPLSVDAPRSTGMEIGCTADRAVYGRRQRVTLEINASNGTGNPVETSLVVSVVRKGLLDAVGVLPSGPVNPPERVEEVGFPPEWGGHFIRGNISYGNQGIPVAGHTLLYSVTGDCMSIDYSVSDSNGNFSFLARNLAGLHEVVIQDLDPTVTGCQIRLEDPFAADFLDMQLPRFQIDTGLLEEINRTVIAAQVHALYEDRDSGFNRHSVNARFYGAPDKEIILADYIRLPEMREVFFELVPTVRVKGRGENTEIRIANTWNGFYTQPRPLMLIDGVITPDPMHITGLDPLVVEKIDIVNLNYCLGHLQYPGIVSVYTEDGRCPISFPRNVFRQSYEFLSSLSPDRFPEYPGSGGDDDLRPDYRNTLYWEPQLHTGGDGKARVEFCTSDEAGDFTIRIHGQTRDGLAGTWSGTISVTE